MKKCFERLLRSCILSKKKFPTFSEKNIRLRKQHKFIENCRTIMFVQTNFFFCSINFIKNYKIFKVDFNVTVLKSVLHIYFQKYWYT